MKQNDQSQSNSRQATLGGGPRQRRAGTGFQAILAATVTLLAIASQTHAQSVQVVLDSPQAGTFVHQGDTIDWTISVSVSLGDNQGLAFFCADLAQNESNPATLDIPHADGVPADMTNFSSPDGISNPPDVGMTTGYVGTQFGDAGAMNLLQIGGGQNIFGHALPASTGYLQSDAAVAGIGQNGGVIVASGSFAAPAVDGAYTFELRNVLANVLSQSNEPPRFSLAVAATLDMTEASFNINVGDYCDPFDANCDGLVNGNDIQPFLSAVLTGGASSCSPCAGDTDGDGNVTPADIGAFVADLLAR